MRTDMPLQEVSIKVGDRTLSFKLYGNYHDIQSNLEVLRGQCYPILPWIGDVRTIVDIGANVGAATVFFKLSYPQAAVYSFEPSPDTFQLLTRNVANFQGIQTINCALSDTNGPGQLFLGHTAVTDALKYSEHVTADSVAVELRNADQALRALGIPYVDILKIDTEGHEITILHALQNYVRSARVIYLEYHGDREAIHQILTLTHSMVAHRPSCVACGEVCYVAHWCMAATRMPEIMYH